MQASKSHYLGEQAAAAEAIAVIQAQIFRIFIYNYISQRLFETLSTYEGQSMEYKTKNESLGQDDSHSAPFS
jgi:hypothetical protein